MKQIVLPGIIMFVVLLLVSCKKDSTEGKNNNHMITGKWNVISDEGFSGIGQNNHPVNYAGQSGDYFDFRTNGNLYIKEGTAKDTVTYNLTSDSTIMISSFGLVLNGVQETCSIENLTAHAVTINAPAVITPGGIFGRKVNLSR